MFLYFSHLYTDSLSFLLQSAVEPFTEVMEYPAAKGTTRDV